MCHVSATVVGYIEEFVYVQYMEGTNAISGLYKGLECVFIRWKTADEEDINLDMAKRLCVTDVK